jgi:hypothetical protein
MRQLDARTYYGVDARGAFAMRGGSVLFVPGVKRPSVAARDYLCGKP